MVRTPETGVLLMAYGAPERLVDVEPFLLDIRARETPRELVEEVESRYDAIGGGSPLLGVTRAQASALQARLNGPPSGGSGEAPDPGAPVGEQRARVTVGMRHWRPRIAEAVAELADAGCRNLVAIPLAPHVSRMSVGAYFRALDDALAGLDRSPFRAVHRVEGFYDHPRFLDAWADRLRSGLARCGRRREAEGGGTEEVEILFTAHSLPESILADGDPYPEQLEATARGVMERLATPGEGVSRPAGWRVCYQSAGARAVRWLGPSIDEVLEELAAAGRRRVLVAPVGFVSDHVEVLYDLDLEARSHAEALGIHLERTESLNTAPRFIDALADLVRSSPKS